jgi:hypothetical protein
MSHKCFVEKPNIMLVVKTNLHAGGSAQLVLFSIIQTLTYDQGVDYYR